MRVRTMVWFGVAIVGVLVVVGLWVLGVVSRGPTVAQQGDEIVITNPGLPLASATIGVTVGPKSYELRVERLPWGATKVPLVDFDPSLSGGTASITGASVTGSRLGASFTFYSAIQLSQAGE